MLLPVIAAGGCWTAGQALLPDMGLEWPERFDAVAGARGRESVSTVLLFLAGALLVVSAIGLARAVRRPGRLATTGIPLLGLGGIWLCAGRAAFNLEFLAATSPEVSREQGLAVLTAPDSPAFAVFPLTLLALLLGPLLLTVAVRRTSWLPLAAWVLGIACFLGSEFQVKTLEVVGVAVASAGLVLAARALLRDTGSPMDVRG